MSTQVESPAATHFQPFVDSETVLPEFTLRSVLVGVILGIVFGASSVYLALKVGLTVSASIPIAVLSITIFRALGKSSILENNMTQTIGSAGESVAAGVVFTVPALLLMGYALDLSRTTLTALTGGWLGVLLMIPLRRALIVREHGKLTYPEGTACAEVLIVGEKGGSQAKLVFGGFGLALLYKFLMSGLHLWKEYPEKALGKALPGATLSAEVSPELMGVGYIIGPRVAGIMLAGGALSYLVLIPTIVFFGSGLSEPLFPAAKLIRDMSPSDVRTNFVLYIGAGAVATGGIISLARSLPMILSAFRAGVGLQGGGGDSRGTNRKRPADEPRPGRRRAAVDYSQRRHLLHGGRAWVQPAGSSDDHCLWLLLRHRVVPDYGRNRLFLQSDFRHDRRHHPADLPHFSGDWESRD